MKKSEKQPWNPYPLGVLTFLRATEGISRGAAHVLTVLAARSNYKGETCVGHRGLVQDCKSSKGYVTDALSELYEKGIVKAHPRKRAINQADWRIISPIVLQSRITDEANNSNPQDDSEIQSSYPVGLHNPNRQDDSNPTRQDFSNPNQQGETLQTKPNLTENNLTDSNLRQKTKERKKEGTASLADARYAESDVDVASLESQTLQSPSGLEAEQEQPKEQNPEPEDTCFPADYTLEQKIEWCGEEYVNRVSDIWYKATGLADAENHRDLICDLIYQHGEDLFTYMPLALKDCPQTAGVKWRDFPYFAKNWTKTMGNVRAWERQKQAKLRDRAELSRYGACQQCSVAPAAKSNGFCSPCEKKLLRAQNLLDDSDKLREHHLIWIVGDGDKRFIGTKDMPLFRYEKDEPFAAKCSRLANQPQTMDRMDTLYQELGVYDKPVTVSRGFDPEEA